DRLALVERAVADVCHVRECRTATLRDSVRWLPAASVASMSRLKRIVREPARSFSDGLRMTAWAFAAPAIAVAATTPPGVRRRATRAANDSSAAIVRCRPALNAARVTVAWKPLTVSFGAVVSAGGGGETVVTVVVGGGGGGGAGVGT